MSEHTDCCGHPSTCEQPCFHSAGRTTPGNPGVIASVPNRMLFAVSLPSRTAEGLLSLSQAEGTSVDALIAEYAEMMMSAKSPEQGGITETLAERGTRYGEFPDHAAISQQLKRVMRNTTGWSRLQPHQAEALEMVQHKIARILNGDPNYADSWHDMAGYSMLVEQELLRDAAELGVKA